MTVTRPLQSEMAAWDGFFAAKESAVIAGTSKCREKRRSRGIMIITLKDGSKKEYDHAMSVIDIASDISEGLARMACAGEMDGQAVDLRTVVDSDCELSILTFQDEGGKAAFRHTASHIMEIGRASCRERV